MRKDIKTRVQSAFGDDDQDEAKQYLDWLRTSISEYSSTVRRNIALLITLIAIFELIVSTRKSSFALSGFHIDRSSVVFQALPALVAYLYMQVLTDSTESSDLRDVFTHVFARWSPQAEQNDLDVFLKPAYPLYWRLAWNAREENRLSYDRVRSAIGWVFAIIVLIGTLGFEAQAYYALFSGNGSLHYAIWALSLALTIFCLTASVIYISASGAGEHDV
jgi:hypothetical protein